jgi:hypothetical protein
MVPEDPQTNEAYEYKKTGSLSFEICANFNKASEAVGTPSVVYPEYVGKVGENWQHEAGRACFTRTIDPELYPVRPVR